MREIDPEKVTQALNSYPLKCVFCQIFKQKASFGKDSFVDVLATLCVLMTTVVTTEFALPEERTKVALQKLAEDILKASRAQRENLDNDQRSYVLTLVTKVLDSIMACPGENEPK